MERVFSGFQAAENIETHDMLLTSIRKWRVDRKRCVRDTKLTVDKEGCFFRLIQGKSSRPNTFLVSSSVGGERPKFQNMQTETKPTSDDEKVSSALQKKAFQTI